MIRYNSVDIESQFFCKIYRKDTDRRPARVQEAYEVPGRSGDLILDNKRYPNVEMEYTAVFWETDLYTPTADERAQDFFAWLVSTVGYKELTDADHTGGFYQAAVLTDLEPEYSADRRMAKVEFTLTRKPQFWLTSGQSYQRYTSADTTYVLRNPTRFEARPLIRAYGVGQIVIGGTTITITQNSDSYMDIDCEMQECFFGTASKNEFVELSDYKFPTLAPGDNNIQFGTGITEVMVTPRWWTL